MGTLCLRFLFCEKLHHINMTLLFAAFLLLSSHVFVDAFFTEKCDHGNVTVSLRNLRSCANEEGNENGDFCSDFKDKRNCVFDNMQKCFKNDDIEKEAKGVLAEVRETVTAVLLNPSMQEANNFYLTEDQIETMISSCPNVPDKSFVDNHEPQNIYGLHAFSTDKNCTNKDLKTMDQTFTKCFKDEAENAKSQLRNYISSRRGSIQSSLCSLLYKTVGKCLRLKLPSCLSKKEEAFISSSYMSNIRDSYVAVEGLLHTKDSGISFAKCSIFSGSSYPKSISTLLMLIIVSLKVIYFNE